MTLLEAAEAASQRLLSAPRDAAVQLLARQSADGLAATAVLARTLLRAGVNFHARFVPDHGRPYELDLDDAGTNRILLALGPDLTARLAKLPGTTIVIGHETVVEPARASCITLNPLAHGGDARGASTSTAAFAFALATNEANWDLVALAMAGAHAEGQLHPTPQGWNANVYEQAKRRGALVDPVGLALDEEPLLDALANPSRWMAGLWDPGYAGARTFLRGHDLPQDAAIGELSGTDQQRLAGALLLAHLHANRPAAEAARLFAPRIGAPPPGLAVGRIRALLEAAAAENEPGLTLAWLLGDDAARADLEGLFTRYRERLRTALEGIEGRATQEGPLARLVETKDPALVEALAQILSDRVLVPDRATIVYTQTDGHVRAAVRVPAELTGRPEWGQLLRALESATALRISRTPGISITGPADRFAEQMDRMTRPVAQAAAGVRG